jgi:hypothetical protein
MVFREASAFAMLQSRVWLAEASGRALQGLSASAAQTALMQVKRAEFAVRIGHKTQALNGPSADAPGSRA